MAGGFAHASSFTSPGCARLRKRIKTLRRHVEDAGVVQIVPQCGVESLQQGIIARISAAGLEIGHAQADFLLSEPGARLDPIILCIRRRDQEERDDKEES